MKQGSFIHCFIVYCFTWYLLSNPRRPKWFVCRVTLKRWPWKKNGTVESIQRRLAFTVPLQWIKIKLARSNGEWLDQCWNVTGMEHTRELQKIALQSRLKIPMLFGQDVIHGFQNYISHSIGRSGQLGSGSNWTECKNCSYRSFQQQEFTGHLHQWSISPVILAGAVCNGRAGRYRTLIINCTCPGKRISGKGLGYTDAGNGLCQNTLLLMEQLLVAVTIIVWIWAFVL